MRASETTELDPSSTSQSETAQSESVLLERFYGPPLRAYLGPMFQLLFAALVGLLVWGAWAGWAGEQLHSFFYGQSHLLSAEALVAVFFLSALASALRARMRGVNVRRGWLEFRDVVHSVWPRVRRLRWAQVDGMLFYSDAIVVQLWDGSSEVLPDVREFEALSAHLGALAHQRGIKMERA